MRCTNQTSTRTAAAARPIAGLVAEVRAGEPGAEEALFRLAQPVIMAVARRHGLGQDAELVQVTWLRARRRLDTIDDDAKFLAWLRTVARNQAIEIIRRHQREQRRVRTGLPAELVDPHPFPEPGVDLIRGDDVAWVRRALEGLSLDDRRLVDLLFDGDLSYQEIAEATDRPIGSIGPTRRRILTRLRRQADRDRRTTRFEAMAG